MGAIRKLISLLTFLSLAVLLSACGQTPSALTEPPAPKQVASVATPPAQVSTRVGLLAMKTGIGPEMDVGHGWTYRPMESIQPSICAGKVVRISGVFFGPNGEFVPDIPTATSTDNTCSKLAPAAETAIGVVAGASIVSGAIKYGSNTLSGAVKDGAHTVSGALSDAQEKMTAEMTAKLDEMVPGITDSLSATIVSQLQGMQGEMSAEMSATITAEMQKEMPAMTEQVSSNIIAAMSQMMMPGVPRF
jgi:hypothetical protein